MSDAFDQAMAGLGGTSAPAGASSPAVSSSDPYGSIIASASQKYNVDPRLIRAVMQTESSGEPGAVSNKGATGLMQIDPSNYKALGITNPKDPTQNINGGTNLLSQLISRYGDVQTALTHYVGGDDPKNWGAQTQAYPGKVLANFQHLPATQTTPQSAPATPQPAQQDAFDSAMSAVNAQAPQQQQPNAPEQETSALSRFGHAAAGLADTVLSAPGAAANAADYAVRRALQQSPQQAKLGSLGDFANSMHPVGNAFGVTNTPGYQNEATQRAQAAIGEKVGQGIGAVASATGLPAPDVENMAASASLLVPSMGHLAMPVVRAAANEVGYAGQAVAAGARNVAGAVGAAAKDVGQTASDFGNAVGTVTGIKAPEKPALTNAPMPTPGARGSVGAAGTSYAQQAAAEGVPDAISAKIAAAEKAGTLNPTAAERHIEAGSLPVPVELTAGQASGDVNLLSNEMNSRGKNPELAARFNAQNGQIADNLTAIRDQVSPNVNVPSGAPTGQALVDAYKEMDQPIRDQIAEQYAQARNADGTSALVNATPAMRNFESQIGPTRFNALPSRVQQIFADAKNNSVTLPAQFDQAAGGARAMNARDIMDIDQTLSGAIAEAKSPAVQHDIGQLRDAILSAPIDPAAGPEAVSAFKTAQASARARFQAMDADPAYKAAANDSVPQGEPSALADQFVQKYIAGGKTANVQNMMQNLSNDPVNQELVASALMDHLRQQAGVDLRTGTGNISQAGLNKAIQNLGDKTRIVLGPEASQTVEKLGNVARYTQEQPRGSYVNNSNTFVAGAASAAKSAAEGVANKAAFGVPVGTWTRQALERHSAAKEVARSLEPGAGVGVPLNSFIRGNK